VGRVVLYKDPYKALYHASLSGRLLGKAIRYNCCPRVWVSPDAIVRWHFVLTLSATNWDLHFIYFSSRLLSSVSKPTEAKITCLFVPLNRQTTI